MTDILESFNATWFLPVILLLLLVVWLIYRRRAGGDHLQRVLKDIAYARIEGLVVPVVRGQEVMLDPGVDLERTSRMYVLDRHGLSILAWGIPTTKPYTLRLAPGPYRVEVEEAGEVLRTVSFEVGSEPVRVELDP